MPIRRYFSAGYDLRFATMTVLETIERIEKELC